MTHVPAPPDANWTADWIELDHNDWRRHFTVAPAQSVSGMDPRDTLTVQVQGEQVQTGDVLARYGYIDGGGAFTAAQLRMLAAELLNAADQIDQLNG